MQGVQAKAIDLLIENNISKFPIDPQSLKLPGKSVLFSSYICKLASRPQAWYNSLAFQTGCDQICLFPKPRWTSWRSTA